METFRDSQQAFQDAIRQGALEDTDNNNGKYAGDFMYMHSVKNTDYFKNINTRKYIEVTRWYRPYLLLFLFYYWWA